MVLSLVFFSFSFTACNCNTDLSTNTSCDKDTGVCFCKPNVIGAKCDTCEPGYYLSDPNTCSPCNCDLGGSFSEVCNISTGQCYCRDGVTGQTCKKVEEGRFFPFIDHFIYEAEESDGLLDFSYRLPTDPGANTQFTGSGYALVQNSKSVINFGMFTPPVSGVYEFVLRYRSVMIPIWERVELRLMINSSMEGGAGPPNCSEPVNPITTFLYKNLSMAEVGATSLSVCLRGGRSYTMVMNGFDSGSSDEAELEIDSMVILPKEPEGLQSLCGNEAEYSQCITDFMSLMTRNSAKDSCRDLSFSVLTEILNQTLRMFILMHLHP